MTFTRFGHDGTAMMIALLVIVTPADAHRKKHPPQAAPAVESPHSVAALGTLTPPPVTATAQDEHMAGMMAEMDQERAELTPIGRLLDWLGRLHPMIVHFPIAFFPAALFTAIIGRGRPAFGKPVQFLVVAGGTIAPVAALIGWLNGGMTVTDTDWLLQVHRWLGTGIGVGGLALAIWAIKRPDQDRSTLMIAGLALMTAAIVVQGWFGGAMVHGMDHMNW